MVQNQLTTIALLGSGVVGIVAVGLSLLAYVQFRHTSYRRMLLPLIALTSMFTLAHGLVLVWPTHPLIVDVLEPLAFTAMIIGVGRLLQLHPRISDVVEGDQR